MCVNCYTRLPYFTTRKISSVAAQILKLAHQQQHRRGQRTFRPGLRASEGRNTLINADSIHLPPTDAIIISIIMRLVEWTLPFPRLATSVSVDFVLDDRQLTDQR